MKKHKHIFDSEVLSPSCHICGEVMRDDDLAKYFMKEISIEPAPIGEDGDMTCVSTTERGAFIKFKRWMREYVGDIEADELKISNVGDGWLHALTGKEKKDYEEGVLWYVSYKKESPYRVYVYHM